MSGRPSQGLVRSPVGLPAELWAAIDAAAGDGKRGVFIRAAVERALLGDPREAVVVPAPEPHPDRKVLEPAVVALPYGGGPPVVRPIGRAPNKPVKVQPLARKPGGIVSQAWGDRNSGDGDALLKVIPAEGILVTDAADRLKWQAQYTRGVARTLEELGLVTIFGGTMFRAEG
jgi:hypothetical protein